MLKAPPIVSLDLHISVLQCNFRIYDEHIGQKFQKTRFAILGANSMFQKSFSFFVGKLHVGDLWWLGGRVADLCV